MPVQRGQRGGGEEGARGEGISQMDMMKCLGGHMECLCGMRLQSFLTLFTHDGPCNAGYHDGMPGWDIGYRID